MCLNNSWEWHSTKRTEQILGDRPTWSRPHSSCCADASDRARSRRDRQRRRWPGSGSPPPRGSAPATLFAQLERLRLRDRAASEPNSHAVGSASRPLSAASSRSSSACASAATRRRPAAVQASRTSGMTRDRAIGRWKRLPAEARTALPLYGSTESPANSTASAPAASATRSTVPALPGSAMPTSTATSIGAPERASVSGRSSSSHTVTTPCGVTVSDNAAAADSVTADTRAPACAALASRSALRVAKRSVTNTSWIARGSRCASSTAHSRALAPSARNRPVLSRSARRVSLRAAETRGVFSVKGATPGSQPLVRLKRILSGRRAACRCCSAQERSWRPARPARRTRSGH